MHSETAIDYEVSRISSEYERRREQDEKYYRGIIEENERGIRRLKARIKTLESTDDLAKKCGELSEEITVTKDENAKLVEEVKKYKHLAEERGKALDEFISSRKAESKEIEELRTRLNRELKKFFDNNLNPIKDDIKRLEDGKRGVNKKKALKEEEAAEDKDAEEVCVGNTGK